MNFFSYFLRMCDAALCLVWNSSSAFEAPLQALKEELAAGKPVFQQLVHNYLVQNQHRVRVEMKPDAEMEARRVEAETAWLAQVKASMTAEELREVREGRSDCSSSSTLVIKACT